MWKECPICRSTATEVFLKRTQVPVHQNLLMTDKKAALEVQRGDLTLAVCEACGFIYNQSFEPDKLQYSAAYDNTQTCSPAVRDYVNQLVRFLVEQKGIRNCRIVEVGCGKGSFLRQLVGTENSGNIGYGFDPSYEGPLIDIDGRLRFEKRYYDSTCVDIAADVIICRHVIEHVTDPLKLLGSIRQALANSPNARVFFETPSIEWILTNRVFWDFFYEHCSYFSAQSITTTFEMSGFRVEDIQRVFGQQYLWIEAVIENSRISKRIGGTDLPSLAKSFAFDETEMRRKLEQLIQLLSAQEAGNLAIWGAGAKGVTLANLMDPYCKLIKCIIDLNPRKKGHYLPGTGHPIVDYRELTRYGVTTALLMNPNYYTENLALLREAKISTVHLLNLMDKDR